MSQVGIFETCPPIRECPFIELDRKSPWSGQIDANDPDCVKTRMLRFAGAASWLMKPSLCSDRLHQTTNAQNADYPFHVVGQDV